MGLDFFDKINVSNAFQIVSYTQAPKESRISKKENENKNENVLGYPRPDCKAGEYNQQVIILGDFNGKVCTLCAGILC